MILLWSLLALCLVVGPMAAVAASTLSASNREVPQGAGKKSRPVLLAVFLVAAVFFLVNPHRDVFSGLDAAKYRMLAESFEAGRGFHDADLIFGKVPAAVQPFFLFRDLTHQNYRNTRDGVFQLNDLSGGMKTSPFFIPALPLAAAGLGAIGFSRDLLVPLLGLLWIATVLAVASISGGRTGVFIAAAMIFATAWPAWFLRGFHSECVGGLIVATVISASFSGASSRCRYALFGFLLGLSLAFHLTMAVMAIPVALYLVLRSGKWGETLALILGGMVGTLPLLLINAFVCQPYGDFLDFNSLKVMCASVKEIRAIVAVLLAAGVCGVGVVALAHVRKVRDLLASDPGRRVVSAACVAVCAVGMTTPFAAGGALLEGWRTTFSGISFSAVYIFAAAVVFLFGRRSTLSERFLFTSLVVAALVFVYIKGVEVPAGIWSQRRFGPVVFCMIALLVVPLSKGIRDVSAYSRKLAWLMAFPIGIAPVVVMMSWPAAYLTANNKGADLLVDAMKSDIARAGADALTVFDYYPHSVPYQFSQTASVFGIAESAATVQGHGPVMKWLAEESRKRPVRIVSSYSFRSPLVEDGVMLKLVDFHKAMIHATATKAFFPIERRDSAIVNLVYDVIPIDASNRFEAVQTKTLDGGPLGLRPPWGRVVKNGMWSLEGSGIVGTLPRPGEKVEIKLTASWYPPNGDWTNQAIVVTPPFQGNPLEMTVQAGRTCIRADTIARGADDTEERGQTGVYRIYAKTPYNPEEFGISGFGEGLGAVIESVSIRVLKPEDGVTMTSLNLKRADETTKHEYAKELPVVEPLADR